MRRAAVPRKPILSPTRIATYLECAMKYRYIYVDKIGRFYLRSRAGYSFGSTLHHVLQEFHAQGGDLSAAELAAGVETHWIGAGYASAEQETEHRDAGLRIVETYHLAHQARREQAVETIATEKTISWDAGRFKLRGRVDRIDRHADGLLEIIDYKSGRVDVSPEEVADSLAMNCYQLILSKSYPDTPVMGTIYCLRSGNQASAVLDGDNLKRFEQDIVVLGGEILDRDYLKVEPGQIAACAGCDFLPRCERTWRRKAEEERWESADPPHSEFGL